MVSVEIEVAFMEGKILKEINVYRLDAKEIAFCIQELHYGYVPLQEENIMLMNPC